MLTIEKGIPIPSTKERKGENVELLRAMKPGDSVFFDAPIIKKATRFYRVAKKLGVNVIIRREGAGMRLWLVGEKTEGGLKKTVRVEKVRLGDTKKNVVSTTVESAKKTKKAKKTAPRKATKADKKTAKKAVQLVSDAAKKVAKAARDKKYRESKKAAKAAPVAKSVAETAGEANA